MTLSEIERQLHENPGPLLRSAGLPSDAVFLPRRIRRAIAYYRRALKFSPMEALRDDMRDQRFDPMLHQMTLPDHKVDQMCQAYEQRAQRQHYRALARTVSSRLKAYT